MADDFRWDLDSCVAEFEELVDIHMWDRGQGAMRIGHFKKNQVHWMLLAFLSKAKK